MSDICNLKHKSVDEKIERHEAWLGKHEKKINQLSLSDAANTQSINNLCRQLSGLTKAIWWLIGLGATGLTGFFFYVIEKGLNK